MANLIDISRLFLKLGFVAFGGPAAHIAMMQEEVVDKREWMTRQHFLDLVGATNLIPGPNSTQMVMHCGLERGGISGLLAAGGSFILPATLLTGILAWIYITYQSLPALEGFLFGIKPAVLAVILGAVYQLGKKALKGWQLGVIGALVAVAALYGVNEVVAILGGGIVGIIWLWATTKSDGKTGRFMPIALTAGNGPKFFTGLAAMVPGVAGGVTLSGLFWAFTKIALVLFGSGYVLIAYMEGELVNRLGWLTSAQLLDAIAIGQFTPGPVLSTATFVGYQISGFWGAIVATIGIFLPSFVLVGLLNPVIPRLRKYPLAGLFLDAVNISALGIMIAVCAELGMAVLGDWRAMSIFVVSLVLIFGPKKVSSVWIVVGSALLGFFLTQL